MNRLRDARRGVDIKTSALEHEHVHHRVTFMERGLHVMYSQLKQLWFQRENMTSKRTDCSYHRSACKLHNQETKLAFFLLSVTNRYLCVGCTGNWSWTWKPQLRNWPALRNQQVNEWVRNIKRWINMIRWWLWAWTSSIPRGDWCVWLKVPRAVGWWRGSVQHSSMRKDLSFRNSAKPTPLCWPSQVKCVQLLDYSMMCVSQILFCCKTMCGEGT